MTRMTMTKVSAEAGRDSIFKDVEPLSLDDVIDRIWEAVKELHGVQAELEVLTCAAADKYVLIQQSISVAAHRINERVKRVANSLEGDQRAAVIGLLRTIRARRHAAGRDTVVTETTISSADILQSTLDVLDGEFNAYRDGTKATAPTEAKMLDEIGCDLVAIDVLEILVLKELRKYVLAAAKELHGVEAELEVIIVAAPDERTELKEESASVAVRRINERVKRAANSLEEGARL